MPSVPHLALCAAVATLALAGCGDASDSGSSYGGGGAASGDESADTSKPAPKGVVATIEVEETEYKIDPPDPRVGSTGTVAFEVTNAGKIGHALEVEGPKGEVEIDEIAPGDTAKLTADLTKPGKYKWYCPIADHEQRGMTGSIVVGNGGTDQPRKEGEAGPGSGGHGGY